MIEITASIQDNQWTLKLGRERLVRKRVFIRCQKVTFCYHTYFKTTFCAGIENVFGQGNGNPLQYSCLENPRDGEAWWAAIYGVAQSRTRLKWLSSSSSKDVCKKKKICKGKGRKMLELCPQKQVGLLRCCSFRLNELKGECAGIPLWGRERKCL